MVIALWIIGILAALFGVAAWWFTTTKAGGGDFGADILSAGNGILALALTVIWLVLMVIHLWP